MKSEMLAADAETARDRQVTTARNSARIRFVFKVKPSYKIKAAGGRNSPGERRDADYTASQQITNRTDATEALTTASETGLTMAS